MFVLCSVLTNNVDSWDCEFKDVVLCSINMKPLFALLLLWDFYVPPQLLHVVNFWWKWQYKSYNPLKYFRPINKRVMMWHFWRVKDKGVGTVCYWYFLFSVLEVLVPHIKAVCACGFHVSVAEVWPSGKTWLWCEWCTRTESTPFLQWNRLGNGSFCQCHHLVICWRHDLRSFETCCLWPE